MAIRTLSWNIPGCHNIPIQFRRSISGDPRRHRKSSWLSDYRHLRQLARQRCDLLDRMDREMGVDRKVVQSETRDSAETEGKDRQVGRVAGTDSMGSVRRRCDRYCSWILQDTPWLDNGPAPCRQVCTLSRLESYLRFVLILQ